MSKTVNVRKGLDIRLIGEADKVKIDAPIPSSVALKPADFHGLVPKMLVKVGDQVKIGEPVFCDKYNDLIKFVSPVCGEILDIVRGEKRKILEVRISVTEKSDAIQSEVKDPSSLSGEEVKKILLDNGLWPLIMQRPLDIIADPNVEPKAIFISAFDSHPLAPDLDFVVHGQDQLFQNGLNALKKLTSGKVHLSVRGNSPVDSTFSKAKNVEIHKIYGKHPAGNIGTQIHFIEPVDKGDTVYTITPQNVIAIGKFFAEGVFDAYRIVALTGSEAKNRKYYRTLLGSNISGIVENNVVSENVRYISGNALTGHKIEAQGYLGYYDSQITILPEGDQYKFFLSKGWLGPGFDKFSSHLLFPTWLFRKKKYRLDTNMNGEERGFVVTGEMDAVMPLDILPLQLIKAIMTKDIDAMEALGIYEVAPEDFALCEYVCTSKIDIQDKIREGLDLIKSECM